MSAIISVERCFLQTTEHLVLRIPLGLTLIKVQIYLTKLMKRFERFHNALFRIYNELIIEKLLCKHWL